MSRLQLGVHCLLSCDNQDSAQLTCADLGIDNGAKIKSMVGRWQDATTICNNKAAHNNTVVGKRVTELAV